MDLLQRQKELAGWDQSVIEGKTALILGVGGLGTNIAVACCRLGVAKLILLDLDVVDVHNLNRQILYRAEHVGKSKVECAKEELMRHSNVCDSDIETHYLDAVKNWQLVVNLIQQSDFVFNTIDYGDYFDHSIGQVCDIFHKPVVLGGTEPFYGHTVSYFLQGNRVTDKKYWDCHDLSKKSVLEQLAPDKILAYDDLSFLPKDTHPTIGGSTVYSAGICSYLMVGAMINFLLASNEEAVRAGNKPSEALLPLPKDARPFPPHTTIFNIMTMESTHWSE